MKALRIVSKNRVPNYWCRECKHSMDTLIKVDGRSFCELCVPEQFKDKLVTVNQNRERIN